jgi:hypothetical protein
MSQLTTDLANDKAWIVAVLEPVVLILLVTGISVLVASLI